jgi:hypothetical protein
VIIVRVNMAPRSAPVEFGLSHRAYVEAWRNPGIDTGAFRVDRAGNRGGMVETVVKLVNGLGRRSPR